MPDLLIATQNKHKQAEIQAILVNTMYNVISPNDVSIPDSFDVKETGHTYAENAELKAIAFGRAAKVLTVADDSGFSVEALSGKPGVFSKRYIPGTDEDRNNKILQEMRGKKNVAAAFITVLCLYDPETNITLYFEGRVKGSVSSQIKGTAGFGYDPIFIPEGYTQTFAELGQELKNRFSHRAQALAKLKEHLLMVQN